MYFTLVFSLLKASFGRVRQFEKSNIYEFDVRKAFHGIKIKIKYTRDFQNIFFYAFNTYRYETILYYR